MIANHVPQDIMDNPNVAVEKGPSKRSNASGPATEDDVSYGLEYIDDWDLEERKCQMYRDGFPELLPISAAPDCAHLTQFGLPAYEDGFYEPQFQDAVATLREPRSQCFTGVHG